MAWQHILPSAALEALGYDFTGRAKATRVGDVNCGSNPLDSYFPFDPYILRRSSRYVASPDIYRYWQGLGDGEDRRSEDGQDSDVSLTSEDEADDDWDNGPGRNDTSDDSDGDDDDGSEAMAAMSLETPSDYNMMTMMQNRNYKPFQRRRIGSVGEEEDLEHMDLEDGDIIQDEEHRSGHHQDMPLPIQIPVVNRVRKESIGSVGSW